MSTISSYNGRTYGRKPATKRKQLSQADFQPRKRRKSSEERDKREESTDTEDDPIDPLSLPQLHNRNLPGRFNSPQPRAAKELSGILQQPPATGSPQTTPTKLASRMLGRSKTESSITNNETLQINRTPSLPNIPSPKPSPSANLETRAPPIPKPSNTRTYAGKSRSFLVSIPASSMDPFSAEQDEDEYSARESYASLRSRWGVDNSEDDPYPAQVSPRRITDKHTLSSTPSKSSRVKSKAQQEASFRAQSLPDGMMNPLKSITELRSKGESRRFLDEVGYLLEGMDPRVGLSLRRASALEITTKLCDAEFFRRAKAADFFNKAWDIFLQARAGGDDDILSNTILAFFAALVSREPACLIDIAQRSAISTAVDSEPSQTEQSHSMSMSLVDTLFSLLNAPADPLLASTPHEGLKNDVEIRKSGVSKKDRALFQTIHRTIELKSSLFPADTPLSVTLLALRALRTLPQVLIPPVHLPTLIISLQNSIPVSLHPASTSTHFSWPETARTMAFENVYSHLRLFDAYLIGQWGATRTIDNDILEAEKSGNEAILVKARDDWLSDELIALGVCAELAGGASAQRCMEVTLRVLVSLTHGDQAWGHKVAGSDYSLSFILRIILTSYRSVKSVIGNVEKANGNGKGKLKQEDSDEDLHGITTADEDETDEAVHAIDMLCLALGLLTNLVQVVDTIKDLLRETRINPSCDLRKRACIRQCVCDGHTISAIDIFVQIYNNQFPHSVPKGHIKSERDLSPPLDSERDPADILFLRGHLAVLFGLLIRGSRENQDYILDVLGGIAAAAKLAEHAREFATFYSALGGGKEMDQDGAVARDVVTFLEKLKA